MQNISRANITKLDRLYDLANENNIPIDRSCPDNIMSVSFKLPNELKIIGIREKYKQKQETDLELMAHEMGHCMTDSFYDPYSPLDLRGKHEYKANWWAIKKVIPFKDLCKAIKGGYREYWELAEYFGVSENFIHKTIELYRQKGKTVPKTYYEIN